MQTNTVDFMTLQLIDSYLECKQRRLRDFMDLQKTNKNQHKKLKQLKKLRGIKNREKNIFKTVFTLNLNIFERASLSGIEFILQ